MNRKQWVQHVSGQGEKYGVYKQCGDYWEVSANSQDRWYLRLPINDYVPCDPPEEWEDVTERITESTIPGNWVHGHYDMIGVVSPYRLRKVHAQWLTGETMGEARPGWAFIVERRKS